MSSIKLADIATELEQNKWKLISTKYINLDSDLEASCPQGHTVHSTWRKMRQHLECPICNNQTLAEQAQIATKKQSGEVRVLAFDQATHTSGWSVYSNKKLIAYGTFEAKDGNEDARFHQIKEWVAHMIEIWEPDCVGLEGIQYQKMIGITTYQTLARLQGVLIDLLYEKQIKYKIIPTATWRTHCGVTGSSRTDKKRSMQLKIQEWYQMKVDEDTADAAGIGKYLADTMKSTQEVVKWI